MDFLEELKWRGLIHDTTPGLEEHLKRGMVTGYIGFDPTAASLTIGNYVQVMLLTFLQRSGHRPLVLMGGATGRIGDPSGKDKERDLKSYDELDKNLAFQVQQVKQFLDFSNKEPNGALMVNNHDFYAKMGAIDFLRDVGKYLTVSYMLAKESVQRRIETGISFTEFSYQLLQGYDFVLLNESHGVTLQMGGSDQYGNITSGIELGRKIKEKKFYAVTTPLLTKKDGTKFGKSSEGNIWLDAQMTSPYKFYQFWINSDDSDFEKFYRYFSLKTKAEIEELEAQYGSGKNARLLKEILAEELTTRVHGSDNYQSVLEVSRILFDQKLDTAQLTAMRKPVFETVAKEISTFEVPLADLKSGVSLAVLLTEKAPIYSSKTEMRKSVQNNALSVNKVKVTDPDLHVFATQLLDGGYLLIEAGKKNKYLLHST
jgi:tyrosyl-tRNA synthetase